MSRDLSVQSSYRWNLCRFEPSASGAGFARGTGLTEIVCTGQESFFSFSSFLKTNAFFRVFYSRGSQGYGPARKTFFDGLETTIGLPPVMILANGVGIARFFGSFSEC